MRQGHPGFRAGAVWVAIVALAVLAGTAALAAEGHKAMAHKGGGEHFLIISPHTADQCLAVLDDMVAKEPQILAKTEWGCMAGDHTGYMMVEAKDEAAAKNMVPELVRAQAKVIKLNKFTAEQIKSFHQKS